VTESTAVLGLNCAHDAAACLVLDGIPVVAVAEERLSRVKHHEGFPQLALDYCLEVAGRSLADIDCVVVNEYEQTDHSLRLDRELADHTVVVRNPSHHHLHATYAAAASGFTDAAVLIVDGSGYSYGEYVRNGSELLGPEPADWRMEEAESQFVLVAGRLELVAKRWGLWEASDPYYRFPSLGHMFSVASQYIFGHMSHAGKTMGLAPYGDPDALGLEIVGCDGDTLTIDTEWILGLPPRSDRPAIDDQVSKDLAATVQRELERGMLFLADRIGSATGSRRLCVAGGVALNSVANGLIARSGRFDDVFVTPAAGDSGVAVGAALLGHERLGRSPRLWAGFTDFLGRDHGPTAVRTALGAAARSVSWEHLGADAPRVAAEELAAGGVIAWFEGRSELGPRALGHRSILADPRGADLRERMNRLVKLREPFRPYAAAILWPEAIDYFESVTQDPFMLTVAMLGASARDIVPAVCHVDGTCRIQSVDGSQDDGFSGVLRQFCERTGVPMILNTSFNVRGEPIVETPADAIRCFLASNIEALFLDGFRVSKHRISDSEEASALIPSAVLLESWRTIRRREHGGWSEPVAAVQTRTGHWVELDDLESATVGLVDGERTVLQIAGQLGRAVSDVVATFDRLQRAGLVAFEMALDAANPDVIEHG
jgi:carbamoyltransferase